MLDGDVRGGVVLQGTEMGIWMWSLLLLLLGLDRKVGGDGAVVCIVFDGRVSGGGVTLDATM
jgi:hypothetical protein